MADHLSWLAQSDPLENTPIKDTSLMNNFFFISYVPWYADIANNLVMGTLPSHWTKQDTKKKRLFLPR